MALFLRAVQKLSQKGFISETTDRITILSEGREAFIQTQPRKLEIIKPWREVPERFQGVKISSNSFYVPSKKRLDLDVLKGDSRE